MGEKAGRQYLLTFAQAQDEKTKQGKKNKHPFFSTLYDSFIEYFPKNLSHPIFL
jgi:hypothetical protein